MSCCSAAPISEIFSDAGDAVDLALFVADRQCLVTNPSDRAIGTLDAIFRLVLAARGKASQDFITAGRSSGSIAFIQAWGSL